MACNGVASQITGYTVQAVKDTGVGGAKGLANTFIGLANTTNGALNSVLSLTPVRFRFQPIEEFNSATPGEGSAMLGMAIITMIGTGGESAEIEGASQLHHIATDKNIVGGFTAIFERLFAKAGMSLQDSENLVQLEGHAGRHAAEYHQWVLSRLENATKGLSGADLKTALVQELRAIRDALIRNPGLVKGK
jgi:hypothetical protein